MAEIFGTVAAAASLVELFMRGRDKFQRNAEKLEAFEKTRLSGISQVERLRVMYKSISIYFSKYNRDVEAHLDPKDQDDIRALLWEMSRNSERCEGVIQDLKVVMKTGNSRKEIDRLRQDLRDHVDMFSSLQSTLTGHITFEISRRLSEGANSPRSPDPYARPAVRRTSTGESSLSSSSGKRPEGPLSRQNTDVSERTFIERSSTRGFGITRVGTGTSIGSNGSSSNSTQNILFVDSKQLNNAVEERDLPSVERIIDDGRTSTEVESRKASALLLACRYRRPEIVKQLLALKASVDATDDKGFGVLHCAIGECEIFDDAQAKESVTILRYLIQSRACAHAAEDTKERKRPLHCCAMTGNYYAAKYLLEEAPGIVNLTDANKKTALYHACEHHSPNERLVKLLLEKKGTFGKRPRPKLQNHPRYQKIRRMLDEVEKRRSLSG